MVLLTGLATLGGFMIDTKYTASASVIIEPGNSRVVTAEQVVPGLSLDTVVVDNQVDIIRSHSLIDQTMAQLRLYADPEFNPPTEGLAYLVQAGKDWLHTQLAEVKALVLALLQGPEESTADPFAQSPEEAARELSIGMFADDLAVARSTNSSSAIWITFTSEDPGKAARIANTMADLYVANQLREKREATEKANAWLREQLQTQRQEVIEAEQAVAQFQADNQLFASKGTALTEEQLADLNKELIDTRAQKVEQEARLQQIRGFEASGKGLDSIPEVVASPLIADLRQRQSDLHDKEAEARTMYGPRHPQMQALQEAKARLAAGIQQEVDRIIGSLQNELTVLTTREQSVEQELQKAMSNSASASQAGVRLRELEREATARRELYETMLARYQETQKQEELHPAGRAGELSSGGAVGSKHAIAQDFFRSRLHGIGGVRLHARPADRAARQEPAEQPPDRAHPAGAMPRPGAEGERATARPVAPRLSPAKAAFGLRGQHPRPVHGAPHGSDRASAQGDPDHIGASRRGQDGAGIEPGGGCGPVRQANPSGRPRSLAPADRERIRRAADAGRRRGHRGRFADAGRFGLGRLERPRRSAGDLQPRRPRAFDRVARSAFVAGQAARAL